jgi:hypothetical protein
MKLMAEGDIVLMEKPPKKKPPFGLFIVLGISVAIIGIYLSIIGMYENYLESRRMLHGWRDWSIAVGILLIAPPV